ncbi:MAG: Tat pathway signal protein, partial [Thermoguttaceae bacterium]|nr:Tat pathway signal protein [Thermoguttaceae bacterium]
RDFLFFVEEVEKYGVRPWIWADYCWKHEDFLEWAPKSVLMSNWYYGKDFDPEKNVVVKRYLDLDAAGFEQIPAGSNWSNNENFGMTVDFCRKNLSSKSLKGFLQTPWHMTHANKRDHLIRSIQQVSDAK